MIRLDPLRSLDLAVQPSRGRPSHISAASGLVAVGDYLYVVADDELHLGVFPAKGARPGTLFRLFEGSLPDDRTARKAHKPDLETLLQLPPSPKYSHGALLALGSGSRFRRLRGALIPLASDGSIAVSPQPLDLTPLYDPLAHVRPQLNIEGGAVVGGELLLFQRGNVSDPVNPIIRYDLAAALDALTNGTEPPPPAIHSLDLGRIDGIPLTITDAAALPAIAGLPGGGIVFTAVAEDTEDAYRDGPLAGAALGLAHPDGRLIRLELVDPPVKLEGIAACLESGNLHLLLVNDPDDPAIAASLYSAQLVL